MSILSFEFIGFALGVTLLFYCVPLKARWFVLLVASLAFYAVSGWQGLAYLVCVVAITYGGARAVWQRREKAAQSMEDRRASRRYRRQRKAILACALIVCLGALVFIKYFDAARAGLNSLFAALQWKAEIPALRLLVPLGLSYFTFQSAGYLIDIYRGKYAPEQNPLKYLLFVSFFPQMTQGPISPYPQLMPQLLAPKRFAPDSFVFGAQLAIWGYFKKLVIADRLAPVTAAIAQGAEQPGWLILLGAVLFAIRLYADFSGGMDVIRGVARMLGVDMVENFRRPFFSKSVAEYWRRWHMSLGAWFRTYLFYPLTTSGFGLALGRLGRRLFGKKTGRALPGVAATFVIFLAIGIWHTANWNAVLYGVYFGVVLSAALLLEPAFKAIKRRLRIHEKSAVWAGFCMLRTWLLILIAQYFAFSAGPQAAFALLGNTARNWRFAGFGARMGALLSPLEWGIAGVAIAILFIVDILLERGVDVGGRLARGSVLACWPALLLLIALVLVFGCYGEGYDATAFLYTQF